MKVCGRAILDRQSGSEPVMATAWDADVLGLRQSTPKDLAWSMRSAGGDRGLSRGGVRGGRGSIW